MMEQWQRDLCTAFLRGMELIAAALRKALEDDKRLRLETKTMVVDVSAKTVSMNSQEH